MRLRHLFLLLLTGAATSSRGQVRLSGKDTALKGATIEVIQAYKPQVKQAPKPEWVPQLPPPDTSHKKESYDDVPQQSLYFTYTSMPLHPLALGKQEVKLPFENYVRLGAGNLNTIYGDAGIGGLRGDNYETNIHLHHLSQKGDLANQQSSVSGLEAEGTVHSTGSDFHAGINAARNQFYYYGYPHDLYTYTPDEVRQTYTSLRLLADLKSKGDSTTKFSYHPAVSGSLYSALHNTSETNFGFDVPLAYRIENKLEVIAGISGAITQLKADTISTANNYLQAKAGFGFSNHVFTGHALIGYAIGKDNNYLLPDIYACYQWPLTEASVFAGIHSALRQNTYEQLTTENPFITNNYITKQTASYEYFAGLQSEVGDHFSFVLRASYWDYSYLPAFVNAGPDMKQFMVGYYNQDVTALSFRAGGRYKQADKWSAGVTADLFRFNTQTVHFVVNEPSTRVKADLIITPIPKLTITAYASLLAGINAYDAVGRTVNLNTCSDIGGGGEYLIVPRLSVFLQLNNVLNQHYERWLGYQAYGLNIYGGLRLKF